MRWFLYILALFTLLLNSAIGCDYLASIRIQGGSDNISIYNDCIQQSGRIGSFKLGVNWGTFQSEIFSEDATISLQNLSGYAATGASIDKQNYVQGFKKVLSKNIKDYEQRSQIALERLPELYNKQKKILSTFENDRLEITKRLNQSISIATSKQLERFASITKNTIDQEALPTGIVGATKANQDYINKIQSSQTRADYLYELSKWKNLDKSTIPFHSLEKFSKQNSDYFYKLLNDVKQERYRRAGVSLDGTSDTYDNSVAFEKREGQIALQKEALVKRLQPLDRGPVKQMVSGLQEIASDLFYSGKLEEGLIFAKKISVGIVNFGYEITPFTSFISASLGHNPITGEMLSDTEIKVALAVGMLDFIPSTTVAKVTGKLSILIAKSTKLPLTKIAHWSETTYGLIKKKFSSAASQIAAIKHISHSFHPLELMAGSELKSPDEVLTLIKTEEINAIAAFQKAKYEVSPLAENFVMQQTRKGANFQELDKMQSIADEYMLIENNFSKLPVTSVEATVARGYSVEDAINYGTNDANAFSLHIGNVTSNHRFTSIGEGGVYTSVVNNLEDLSNPSSVLQKTIFEELKLASGTPIKISSREVNLSRVLDLRDEKVISQVLGINYSSLIQRKDATYLYSQILGHLSQYSNLEAILVPSAQNTTQQNLIILRNLP